MIGRSNWSRKPRTRMVSSSRSTAKRWRCSRLHAAHADPASRSRDAIRRRCPRPAPIQPPSFRKIGTGDDLFRHVLYYQVLPERSGQRPGSAAGGILGGNAVVDAVNGVVAEPGLKALRLFPQVMQQSCEFSFGGEAKRCDELLRQVRDAAQMRGQRLPALTPNPSPIRWARVVIGGGVSVELHLEVRSISCRSAFDRTPSAASWSSRGSRFRRRASLGGTGQHSPARIPSSPNAHPHPASGHPLPSDGRGKTRPCSSRRWPGAARHNSWCSDESNQVTPKQHPRRTPT